MTDGNTGLRTRGLLLFGLVAVIATVALVAIVRWPSQEAPHAPPEGVEPSPAGWEIRYQATISLARRGSKKVPFETLREMLDEKKQLRNFVTKLQDGREVSDEGAARRLVISAANAFVEWHKSPAAAQLDEAQQAEVAAVYAAIDKLRDTENLQMRAEIEKARAALGRKT
jgi:hypothetical protein